MRHYPNRPSAEKTSSAVSSYPNVATKEALLAESSGVFESDSDRSSSEEHFSDSDMSVVDAADDYGPYVEGDNIMYTTGEVAARLNISRDMARIYIREFEEFLHVSKSRDGKYGHTSIQSTDMEVLEHIVRLRKNRHSVEQVKQILRDPYLAEKLDIPTGDYSALLNEALAKSNAALLAEVSRIIEQSNEQNRLLLESNSEKDEKISSLSQQVQDLKKLVNKQSDALLDQSDALKDQYDVIKEQTAIIQSVKAMLEEQSSNNKKKGLFGLFK